MAISHLNSSRRGFLTTIAAGSALLPRSLRAAEDPRLAQVLARTISIDLHSHVGIPFGQPNAPLPRFDLPGEMKRTGFSAVIQTYEVDSVPAGPGEDYKHNLEGRIERIEEVYKRGLRNPQLVHERDDKVKPLADIYTRPPHLGGLTDFGADVIRACNRLGIVIDMTHMVSRLRFRIWCRAF